MALINTIKQYDTPKYPQAVSKQQSSDNSAKFGHELAIHGECLSVKANSSPTGKLPSPEKRHTHRLHQFRRIFKYKGSYRQIFELVRYLFPFLPLFYPSR